MREKMLPTVFGSTILSLSFTSIALTQNAQKDFLRTAAEGYLSNREAFVHLTCKYTIEIGRARTVNQALSGRLENRATHLCLWLVNDANKRQDMTGDPKAVKGNRKGHGNTVNARESFFLDNGSIQLHAGGKAANVCPPENPSPGISNTPFDMGVMGLNEVANPGRQIHDCLQSGRSCRFDGMEDMDGKSLAVVSLKEASDWESKYFLDPERGFLPIKIISWKPGKKDPYLHVLVTEARECSKGRWFPWRSVVFFDETSLPVNARQYVVLELDADSRPNHNEFFVDLAKGTIVNDTQLGQITLEEPFRATLNNLPELLARCRLKAEAEGLRAKTPRKDSVWTFVWISGAVVAGLLVVTWFVKRYRRNQEA